MPACNENKEHFFDLDWQACENVQHLFNDQKLPSNGISLWVLITHRESSGRDRQIDTDTREWEGGGTKRDIAARGDK